MNSDKPEEVQTSHRVDVTKEFLFNAAHRLPFHKGKCKNWHGHSYRLLVTVSTTNYIHDDKMVMDFGLLKRIVKGLIINRYDHAMIISPEDRKYDFYEYPGFEKKVFISYESTAENLAFSFALILAGHLRIDFKTLFACSTMRSTGKYLTGCKSKRPDFVSVRLYENPESYAEVTDVAV